jgi:hypothetical protein
VRLSFEEIRNRAAASVQATRRLRACLEDLLGCAPEGRRAPLERQLRLLDAEIDSNADSSGDSGCPATERSAGHRRPARC